MGRGLLIDTTLCIGCGVCSEACKGINELPGEVEEQLTAYTWTTLHTYGEEAYSRKLCLHCEKPTCVSVCPVGALEKTAAGPVVYHEKRCIGCRYCMVACPFGIPKYEWDKTLPRIQKCIMCAPRLAEGEIPACADVCPTGATMFGEREDLLREARRRLVENPSGYVDHIYGEHEVGGTAVLFLSDVNYAQLGFPAKLSDQPLPELTWRALSLVPQVASLGGAFLFGLWWIINRRMDVQREAGRTAEAGDGDPRR